MLVGQLAKIAALVADLGQQLASEVLTSDQNKPQPGAGVVVAVGGEMVGDAVAGKVVLELLGQQVALQGLFKLVGGQSLTGQPGLGVGVGRKSVPIPEGIGGCLQF